LAVDGCAVAFGTARRGLGGLRPAQSPPRCTKCNSPPINGQCTDHRIAIWWSVALRFNVAIKGLSYYYTKHLSATTSVPYHFISLQRTEKSTRTHETDSTTFIYCILANIRPAAIRSSAVCNGWTQFSQTSVADAEICSILYPYIMQVRWKQKNTDNTTNHSWGPYVLNVLRNDSESECAYIHVHVFYYTPDRRKRGNKRCFCPSVRRVRSEQFKNPKA